MAGRDGSEMQEEAGEDDEGRYEVEQRMMKRIWEMKKQTGEVEIMTHWESQT